MCSKSISTRKEKRNALNYIIYELLKGKKLSTKDMTDLVGKNQRTCQRYVKELEDSDLPMRSDGVNYYLNTDDGYVPFYLSKDKINLLYLSLISFSAFDNNFKLIKEVIKQIEELTSPYDKVLLDNIKENLVVKRRYSIINKNSNNSYQVFMLLLEAFSKLRSAKIRYKSKKKHECRTIDVYGFCLAKETYYINAYCHKANTLLMFRIDRITECSLDEGNYQIPKEFDVKQYYRYTWEVENTREPFDFEVLFCENSAHNIIERKWCENQEIVQLEEGNIIFKGTTSSEIELKKWILSFGSEGKVISPLWLKEIIKCEFTKAINLYE